MQAQGVDRVSGSVRREIRRSIEARLTPQAQPQLRGIPFVYDALRELVYAGALSDKQVDAFQIHFAQAVGFSLIPVTPDMAAIKRHQANVRDWQPTSFSPERADDEVSHDPGLDFLTWLWFVAEGRGGQVKVPDVGEVAVMIEGPLLFVKEGGGAHAVGMKGGEPLCASETKSALVDGKKLRRARLTLAIGERVWSVTLDAPTFTFRSLRLPEGEKLDQISKFQERLEMLSDFQRAFLGLFDRFVQERISHHDWDNTLKQMAAWITERRTRA